MSTRLPASHQSPQPTMDASVPVWSGNDYDYVAPGEYSATIVRVAAVEWLRRWRRWNVTVSYELDSGEQVPGYYSLGDDSAQPRVSRRGRYWHLYQAAIGTPGKGAMPPEALKGRKVHITVTDSPDGGYSLVRGESALKSESTSLSESVSPSASESLSASVSPSMSLSLSMSESESESVSVSGNQVQAQAQAQAQAQVQAAVADWEATGAEALSRPLPYGEYFIACLNSGERALSRERYEEALRADEGPQ